MPDQLPDQLRAAVLAYLGVEPAAPDLVLLERLIGAYGRMVPWESASRIVRRAQTPATANCPRWAAEFWETTMQSGSGGTCFESNWAFWSLLATLGYQGYLTINDMQTTRACHTAIIVALGEQRYLVDVGYPLYAAVPLDPARVTSHASPIFEYRATPIGMSEYIIENRPHPRPYLFNLLDTPVVDADYRRATTADYGEYGLFLDRVVINKLIGGRAWRFNSGERPYHLETFIDGVRVDHALPADPAEALGAHFGIDAAMIAAALR